MLTLADITAAALELRDEKLVADYVVAGMTATELSRKYEMSRDSVVRRLQRAEVWVKNRDAPGVRREACAEGHSWEEHGSKNRHGHWYCRACKRERERLNVKDVASPQKDQPRHRQRAGEPTTLCGVQVGEDWRPNTRRFRCEGGCYA